MKSYSAPLIRRDMQITMTAKFHFSPLRLANVKEFNNTEKWLSANCYNFYTEKFVNIYQNLKCICL